MSMSRRCFLVGLVSVALLSCKGKDGTPPGANAQGVRPPVAQPAPVPAPAPGPAPLLPPVAAVPPRLPHQGVAPMLAEGGTAGGHKPTEEKAPPARTRPL